MERGALARNGTLVALSEMGDGEGRRSSMEGVGPGVQRKASTTKGFL